MQLTIQQRGMLMLRMAKFGSTTKRLLLLSCLLALLNTAAAFVLDSPHPFLRARVQKNSLPAHQLHAWSQYVEFDVEDDESLLLRETIPTTFHASDSSLDRSYQLSSPREWLEYQEARNKGHGGAYTVLRCDRTLDAEGGSGWSVWEFDFHWNRLRRSYRELEQLDYIDEEDALCKTEEVLTTLLSEAAAAEEESSEILCAKADDECEACCIYMVTLLWQKEGDRLVIRGHSFTNGAYSIPSEYDPQPITASLSDPSELNRYNNFPLAKQSSWCRERRPLEEQFKVDDVGEVILVRCNDKGSLLLLEGLTSNLFVLFRNGTLKTSDSNVLEGCARSLVLQQACGNLGWTVEFGPIELDSAHEWDEVFLTSAVRLIIPVDKILQGNDQVWHARQESPSSKWRQLYNAILLAEE